MTPNSYGRGLAKGFDDIDEGRKFKPGSCIPYNEECRRLHKLHPDEHPVCEPGRAWGFVYELAERHA